MSEMRAKYEKVAKKNQEELKLSMARISDNRGHSRVRSSDSGMTSQVLDDLCSDSEHRSSKTQKPSRVHRQRRQRWKSNWCHRRACFSPEHCQLQDAAPTDAVEEPKVLKEMAELRDQKSHTVQVDVDAPKGQDLAKILEEMREKYEKIVLQNKRESQEWHESQMKEVQVTENTAALKEATTMVTETRRKMQAKEIDLQSELSLNGVQEAKLRDTEMHNNREVERYNSILLNRQAEHNQLRTDIQQHTQDFEVLLNTRVKLEAEIAEHRRLLGGGDYKHEDALHSSKTIQTKVEMSPLQSKTIQTKVEMSPLQSKTIQTKVEMSPLQSETIQTKWRRPLQL